MPSSVPPQGLVDWATSGTNQTKPTNSIQNDSGMVANIAPTDQGGRLNYILNKVAGWAKFLATTLAPYSFFNNWTVTTQGDVFTATNDVVAYHMRYDDLADRWYCSSIDLASGGNIRAFDSADGITWSPDSNILVSVDCNDESFTPIYSNGTKCMVLATEHSGPTPKVFVSTDNTTANLAAVTSPTWSSTTPAYVRDLLWDPDSSRWFMCGVNSALTTGYIYSSSDDGANWTLEYQSTGNLSSIATDGNGNGLAVHDDDAQTRYVTGGMTGTWAAGGTGPITANRNVNYSPSTGFFVIIGSGGEIQLVPESDLTSAPTDTDWETDMILHSPELTVFQSEAGGVGNAGDWWVLLRGGRIVTDTEHEDSWRLGYLGNSEMPAAAPASSHTTHGGGKGRFVFVLDELFFGTEDVLAYSDYFPNE